MPRSIPGPRVAGVWEEEVLEVIAHACTLPPRDLQGRGTVLDDESSQKNTGLSPMPSLLITLMRLPGTEYKWDQEERRREKQETSVPWVPCVKGSVSGTSYLLEGLFHLPHLVAQRS